MTIGPTLKPQKAKRRPHSLWVTAILVSVAVASVGLPFAQVRPGVQFRTGVVLVPVDVRVVDRDGNPVTDLTAADFTILENGVPQPIAHFLTRSSTSPQPIDRETPLASVGTPNRTFMIVLGRGRLNTPVKALDALIDFVRTKTLPGDSIGVIAYLRATDINADRGAVVRLLERYRDRHEAIEGRIENRRVRASGGVWLAPETRTVIEAFFNAPGLPAVRDLPGAVGTLAFSYSNSAYLRSAVEYLRQVAGEKQLILVSEQALTLGRVEKPGDHYFVRLATGARVAISFIHTGGVPGQPMRRGRLPALRMESFNPFLAADHRTLADQTGGSMAAFYQDPYKPLAQLDRVTRFQYLLGYYPPTAAPDSHRKIEIAVTRPGLRVLYRHGYQARPQPSEPEDLRAVMTEDRIAGVVSFLRDPPPRPLVNYSSSKPWRLSGTAIPGPGGEARVDLHVSFDASRLTFVKQDGIYMAGADLAVIVDDANRQLLAQKAERLLFKFNETDFALARRKWLDASLTVSTKGQPAYLRVVVYEYESDQVLVYGTVELRQKKVGSRSAVRGPGV